MVTFSEPFDLSLEGEYFWERVFYIDNRDNNNEFREERKIVKTEKTSYSELTKYVYDASLKISHTVNAGVKLDIISASVETKVNIDLSTSYEKVVDKKSETTKSEELTREFKVNPNSIGELFRLVYRGPGVTYATDTISTNKSLPLDTVFIRLKVKRVPMIKDIVVVYTDQSIDRPVTVITDWFGGSPDINAGHKGQYVWLVPIWTSKLVSN